MEPKYGIAPDRFDSDRELEQIAKQNGFAHSRSQRDRLKKRGLWPRPVKNTPGRNSTLGAHVIEMFERNIAEATGSEIESGVMPGADPEAGRQ